VGEKGKERKKKKYHLIKKKETLLIREGMRGITL